MTMETIVRIDATPAHPMRCTRVDQTSINVAALSVEVMSPQELSAELLRVAGIVRRGETVDGARVVAVLRAAAGFLATD